MMHLPKEQQKKYILNLMNNNVNQLLEKSKKNSENRLRLQELNYKKLEFDKKQDNKKLFEWLNLKTRYSGIEHLLKNELIQRLNEVKHF